MRTFFEDRCQAVTDRLGVSSSKLKMAVEAAVGGTMPGLKRPIGDGYGFGLNAVELMPQTSTPFEKGIACGIAMMLATEKPA